MEKTGKTSKSTKVVTKPIVNEEENIDEKERIFKESMQHAKKRTKEWSDSGEYLKKPAPGKSVTFRVLPKVGKMQSFFIEAALHPKFKIADKPRMLVCRNEIPVNTGDCPVCQFVDVLKATGDEDNRKLIEGSFSEPGIRKRYHNWVNVALVDKEGKATKVVKIAQLASSHITTLYDHAKDPNVGNIFDPEEGFNFRYKKGNEGKMAKFSLTIIPKPIDIEFPGWKKKVRDLTTTLDIMSREEMIKHIYSNFSEYVEEVLDDLPWTPEEIRLMKGKKSKKKEHEEKDEDVIEDDDTEDEDIEEEDDEEEDNEE